jgi:hypothetical protein
MTTAEATLPSHSRPGNNHWDAIFPRIVPASRMFPREKAGQDKLKTVL